MPKPCFWQVLSCPAHNSVEILLLLLSSLGPKNDWDRLTWTVRFMSRRCDYVLRWPPQTYRNKNLLFNKFLQNFNVMGSSVGSMSIMLVNRSCIPLHAHKSYITFQYLNIEIWFVQGQMDFFRGPTGFSYGIRVSSSVWYKYQKVVYCINGGLVYGCCCCCSMQEEANVNVRPAQLHEDGARHS